MEKTAQIGIKGMTCGGCVASVKRVLEALPGVKSADVTLSPGSAIVRFDDGAVDDKQIAKAVEQAGFEIA